MTYTAPTTYSAATPLAAADLNTYIGDNIGHLYTNLPIRATMWHDESIVTSGAAIARTVSSSIAYCFYAAQSTGANGDEWTQSFVLGEGTYTLYLLGIVDTDCGKVDIDLDGSTIATAQDWYGGSAAAATKSVAGVSIGANEGGRHVLTVTVNGKHASSSGYKIKITKIYLVPSADS